MFEIIPEYRFKKFFNYSLFFLGVVLIVTPLIIHDYEVLYFFGLIVVIVGLLFAMFTSKQRLIVNEDQVMFESKSIVKEFSKSITIKFADMEEVYFLKRRFLLLGGRNPIADADSQTLYNENRIVFVLNNQKSKTIMQVGKPKEFKKAYTMIKNRVETKAQSFPEPV